MMKPRHAGTLLLVALGAAVCVHLLLPSADGMSADRAPLRAPSGDTTLPMDGKRPLAGQLGRTSQPVPEADAATTIATRRATLDRRFAAETVDPAWAPGQEAAIRAALTGSGGGEAAPTVLRAACHRYTCRIDARFPDATTAEQAMVRLSLRLGTPLPYSAVLPAPSDDAGIALDAWYSSDRHFL